MGAFEKTTWAHTKSEKETYKGKNIQTIREVHSTDTRTQTEITKANTCSFKDNECLVLSTDRAET